MLWDSWTCKVIVTTLVDLSVYTPEYHYYAGWPHTIYTWSLLLCWLTSHYLMLTCWLTSLYIHKVIVTVLSELTVHTHRVMFTLLEGLTAYTHDVIVTTLAGLYGCGCVVTYRSTRDRMAFMLLKDLTYPCRFSMLEATVAASILLKSGPSSPLTSSPMSRTSLSSRVVDWLRSVTTPLSSRSCCTHHLATIGLVGNKLVSWYLLLIYYWHCSLQICIRMFFTYPLLTLRMSITYLLLVR